LAQVNKLENVARKLANRPKRNCRSSHAKAAFCQFCRQEYLPNEATARLAFAVGCERKPRLTRA
jgi:hypothetical protein